MILTETLKKTDDDDSVVSRDFDDDIRSLIIAEKQKTKQSSPLTNSTLVLTVKTSSASKTNSTQFSQTDSQSLNYKEILWGLYPDSMETALTTSDEKLKDARNNLKKRLENVRAVDDILRSVSCIID